MVDISLFETFLLKTHSIDGCIVLVGGICKKGIRQKSIQSYLKIKNFKLGQTTDEYLIDVMLADCLKQLSPDGVIVLGASIYVKGVKKKTGGIIGNPFDDNESANEEIEEVIPGIYMIALPEGPGIVYTGTLSDGIILKKYITEAKHKNKLELNNIISRLDDISNLYLIVQDGSGFSSKGIVYISEGFSKQYEEIALQDVN